MNGKKPTLVFYVLCFLFILIPFGALLPRAGSSWGILENRLLMDALAVSLKTTSVMMTAVLLIGTPAAYAYARYDFRGRRMMGVFMDLPLVLPPAVAGLLLLMTFGRQGIVGAALAGVGVQIPFTAAAVVLAQIFVSLPIYVKTAAEGFAAVDPVLEFTAMTLGDSRLKAFIRVTLPLSSSALVTGGIMAWARGLAEFGATIMFAGSMRGITQTLPLAIYSAMETDVQAALGIARVMVLISFVMIGLMHFISYRRRKHD